MKGGKVLAYGITDQGGLQVTNTNNHCFFKQFTFPPGTVWLGITAFEESTSTLIHCGGTQVFMKFHFNET